MNKNIINMKQFPDAHFEYELGAVMQKPGGYLNFKQRNDEGGHVLSDTKGNMEGVLKVPVISVDNYSREHNLQLDMLKVRILYKRNILDCKNTPLCVYKLKKLEKYHTDVASVLCITGRR